MMYVRCCRFIHTYNTPPHSVLLTTCCLLLRSQLSIIYYGIIKRNEFYINLISIDVIYHHSNKRQSGWSISWHGSSQIAMPRCSHCLQGPDMTGLNTHTRDLYIASQLACLLSCPRTHHHTCYLIYTLWSLWEQGKLITHIIIVITPRRSHRHQKVRAHNIHTLTLHDNIQIYYVHIPNSISIQ